MLAIVPVSLVNALFFHRFAHRFDLRTAHLGGAALFLFFAADFLLKVLIGVSVWETIVTTAAGALPVRRSATHAHSWTAISPVPPWTA